MGTTYRVHEGHEGHKGNPRLGDYNNTPDYYTLTTCIFFFERLISKKSLGIVQSFRY
jgi:hypothetical protein